MEDESRDNHEDAIACALSSLDMLHTAMHHEDCQTAAEAGSAIVAIILGSPGLFRMLHEIHAGIFPNDSDPAVLREAYSRVSKTLSHIATHESNARMHAVSKSVEIARNGRLSAEDPELHDILTSLENQETPNA